MPVPAAMPKVTCPIKDAMLVFTAGSSNGRAAYVVKGKGYMVQMGPVSAQVMSHSYRFPAFFVNSSFDLYTDSYYIFKAHQVIETVPCIGTGNDQIKMRFQQIQNTIHHRKLLCFVDHMRIHFDLPGPLADSNDS